MVLQLVSALWWVGLIPGVLRWVPAYWWVRLVSGLVLAHWQLEAGPRVSDRRALVTLGLALAQCCLGLGSWPSAGRGGVLWNLWA